jgi:hypothetical protein
VAVGVGLLGAAVIGTATGIFVQGRRQQVESPQDTGAGRPAGLAGT